GPVDVEANPCTGGSCDTICAQVPNGYFDAAGGDYGQWPPSVTLPPNFPMGAVLDLPYARARITRPVITDEPTCSIGPDGPCIEVVWDGYLDASGCASVDLVPEESYHIWLFGAA